MPCRSQTSPINRTGPTLLAVEPGLRRRSTERPPLQLLAPLLCPPSSPSDRRSGPPRRAETRDARGRAATPATGCLRTKRTTSRSRRPIGPGPQAHPHRPVTGPPSSPPLPRPPPSRQPTTSPPCRTRLTAPRRPSSSPRQTSCRRSRSNRLHGVGRAPRGTSAMDQANVRAPTDSSVSSRAVSNGLSSGLWVR